MKLNMSFSALTLCLVSAGCSGSQPSQEVAVAISGLSPQAAEGQVAFGECALCHAVDPTKGHKIGPNLYGIYGEEAASHPDFAYSRALLNAGLVWDEATLDAYLENPAKLVKGGRMAYRGQPDPEVRAALIAYLKALKEHADQKKASDEL